MVDQEAAAAGSGAEECAWCKFMKGGPCKAVFEVWQSCVDNVMDAPEAADAESRRAAVEKCAGVTAPLFNCLVKHPEYYGPQIDSMAERSQAETDDAAASDGNTSSSSRPGSDRRSGQSTAAAAAVAGVQGKDSTVGQGKLGTAIA